MSRHNVAEVARNLMAFVNRVAYRGERFTLVHAGEAVAELRPVARGLRIGDLPDFVATLPHLDSTELSEFARDLDAARAAMNIWPDARDPWES